MTHKMSEWKALNARVTLFPTAAQENLLAQELYRRIWASEPDSFQKPPNALQPATAQGRRGSIAVGCLAHPSRVDFGLAPFIVQGEPAEPKLALIEDTGRLYAELERIIKGVSEEILPSRVSRIALAAQFVTAKANSAECNKALTKLLPPPYRVTLSDEEDFVLQVNCPRKSTKIDTIRLNFLTKWSVENFQFMNVLIPAGGAQIPASKDMLWGMQRVQSINAASVGFDYNNTVTERALATTEQATLLNECLSEMRAMQKKLGLNIDGF